MYTYMEKQQSKKYVRQSMKMYNYKERNVKNKKKKQENHSMENFQSILKAFEQIIEAQIFTSLAHRASADL